MASAPEASWLPHATTRHTLPENSKARQIFVQCAILVGNQDRVMFYIGSLTVAHQIQKSCFCSPDLRNKKNMNDPHDDNRARAAGWHSLENHSLQYERKCTVGGDQRSHNPFTSR